MRCGLLTVCLLAGCPPPPRPAPLQPDAGEAAGEDAGRPPCLSTFPEQLDFGEIDAFGTAFTLLRVTNLSSEEIIVSTTELDPPFSNRFGENTLQAGDSMTSNVQFRPLDSLLHFAQIELRAFNAREEALCSVRVPVRGLGRGLFTVSPEFLDFGALDPGENRTLEVQLNNTRRVPIVLEHLGIDEDTDAGVPVFTLEGPASIEVAPVSVRTLRITASPPGFDRYGAVLSGLGPLGRVDVLLQVVGGAPVAVLAPESLQVPLVEFSENAMPSSFVDRVVRVRNVGHDAGAGGLRVVSPFVSVEAEDGGPSQTSALVQLPGELFNGLPPGTEVPMLMRLTPGALGPDRFRIVFFTNDPRQPRIELPIGLVATSLPTCSMQRPTSVVFTATGDAGSTGQVTFTNVGTTPCVLDDVRLRLFADPAFSVTSGEIIQRTLAPGERHQVTLRGPDAGAGRLSALDYHLLGEGSTQESVDLSSPP